MRRTSRKRSRSKVRRRRLEAVAVYGQAPEATSMPSLPLYKR